MTYTISGLVPAGTYAIFNASAGLIVPVNHVNTGGSTTASVTSNWTEVIRKVFLPAMPLGRSLP